ncbi:hypothetical protein Mpsy_2472 [Methanolobus psychrophilus R15]|nr:hypothetical protein Mpsy_2472 [Methanolobus psychrophilus R15]
MGNGTVCNEHMQCQDTAKKGLVLRNFTYGVKDNGLLHTGNL